MKHLPKAFTLIELLVVITIITVLIAVLIPALSKAREAGRNAVCLSNLHQFSTASLLFANDRKDHLPGLYTWNLPIDWQRDWLSGEFAPSPPNNTNYYEHAPENGTLYEYMGQSSKSYRCPSLPLGVLGSGVGSNGKYDYTFISGLGGARIWELPDRVYRKSDDSGLNQHPHTTTLPFLVEESPRNNLNDTAIRGAFASTDEIDSRHSSNTNYASPDGSATRFPDSFRNVSGNELWAPGKGYRYDSGVCLGLGPHGFDVWSWLNSD